jgi:hypothetical protein
MTDIGVETVAISASNGGPDPYGIEPKSTILGLDDALSGKLQLKSGGQILGNFTATCGSDLKRTSRRISAATG